VKTWFQAFAFSNGWINLCCYAAVLESVGLVGQGTGMAIKTETISKNILRQQGIKKGSGKIELPEDMWGAAVAAQELLDAVEAAAGWLPGVIAAEELVGREPGAMGVLLCYLFMHFPGERAMRGEWQEETSRACNRAEVGPLCKSNPVQLTDSLNAPGFNLWSR
jgi:hypothetical protein